MNKLAFATVATALLVAGCSAMGNRDMQSAQGKAEMKPGHHRMMGHMMHRMDTNGDSVLSKEEFMAAHEAMFDRMKGPDGTIALQKMPMHGKGDMPMHGKGMMAQCHMMSGGMDKEAK